MNLLIYILHLLRYICLIDLCSLSAMPNVVLYYRVGGLPDTSITYCFLKQCTYYVI